MGWRRVLARVLALSLVTITTACSGTGNRDTLTVHVGFCPGPAPGQHAAHPLIVLHVRGAGSVRTVTVSSPWKVQLSLPPGTYELTARGAQATSVTLGNERSKSVMVPGIPCV
jgi:hypothetical protein